MTARDLEWLAFPGKHPVCRDCGADWSPVRRGECIACGSDSGPLTSDSEPEPHRDAQDGLNVAPRSPRSSEGVSGAQRGTQQPTPDADREGGER